MKVLIQWTRAIPQGWEEIDSSDWPDQPFKPDPTGTIPVIDNEPGWPFAVCIQGITFSGDHYALQEFGDGVRVITWDDDPDDFRVQERRVYDWLLLPPGFDSRFNQVNTRQHLTVYGGNQAEIPRGGRTTGGPVEDGGRFQNFTPPNLSIVRHGCQVPDELAVLHNELRVPVDWREWL